MALTPVFSAPAKPAPAAAFTVIGWDQSPNHCGVVMLDHTGKVLTVSYVTSSAKHAKMHVLGARMPPEIVGIKEESQRGIRRMKWWRDRTASTMNRLYYYAQEVSRVEPMRVGLEDYPLKAAHRAHQMGEIGGAVKDVITDEAGVLLRLHGPESVKIAATGKGDAKKEEMIAAAKEAGFDFSSYGGDACEDLSDAYFIAELLRQEVLVSRGLVSLADLTPHMRKVFLRVTKAHPVNLLDRPWLSA